MARRRPARTITLGQLLLGGLALAMLAGAGLVALLARPQAAPASQAAVPAAPAAPLPAPARVEASGATVEAAGLRVGYRVQPDPTQPDLTEIRLSFADAAGKPLYSPAPPAAWVGYQAPLGSPPPADALSCDDQVRAYVGGGLDSQAEIDLNAYFVLSLNADSTISVIDPLHGVTGISQLYTTINLASPGEDWALSQDGRLLFVSMPRAGQVAVIDSDTFSVIQTIDVGLNPMQLGLQPDGRYLWVGNDSTEVTAGGVTVIDLDSLTVKAQIPTGRGRHPIAFSGRVADIHDHPNEAAPAEGEDVVTYAFVGNSQDGSLAVIDVDRLERHPDIALDIRPTSLAYATSTNTLYAAGADGGLVAVDAAALEVSARLGLGGISDLGFAPGGRWGFALSQASGQVFVIDAAAGQVAHRVGVAGGPDKVSFTSAYAYVHVVDRPEVVLFDLAQIAAGATPTPVKIIGGQLAPGQAGAPAALAEAITPVHAHGGHVLIINPADLAIYQYMEGMNAPMGSFKAYSQSPRAVGVIDRSLRPMGPGTFAASVKIPRSGQYRIALLLDSPRVVQCFTFATAPAEADRATGAGLDLQVLGPEREARAGARLPLRFSLGEPGLRDVVVLVVVASGQRSDRFAAMPLPDGTYQADLLLPAPGSYAAYVIVPSRGVAPGALPPVSLTAR